MRFLIKTVQMVLPEMIVLLLAVWIYFFRPEIWCMSVGRLFPDDRLDIPVEVSGKEYRLPLFFKRAAHNNLSGETAPALVLCNIPLSGGVRHIKVFPDWLGIPLGADGDLTVGECCLVVRGGALDTWPLDEDIKGWNTEYRIVDHGDRVEYFILPGREHRESIRFSVDKLMLARVPKQPENNCP